MKNNHSLFEYYYFYKGIINWNTKKENSAADKIKHFAKKVSEIRQFNRPESLLPQTNKILLGLVGDILVLVEVLVDTR